MTALTRSQALSAAALIRDETAVGGNTATRVGTLLSNLVDSTVFVGEAQTPPTAGNGLTGTNVFSVLPDGATLSASVSGLKMADITGPALLGRATSGVGGVVSISGAEGQAARVAGGALGFGSLATAAYADASVTLAKMADVATDSLIGRDTTGTGAPEVIGLNSTLSMTGSGALQRAALSGAVSAAAGSNVTAFASGNFGALDLATTGSLAFGAAPATAGVIRLGNNTFLNAKDSAVATNYALIGINSSNQIVVGDVGAPLRLVSPANMSFTVAGNEGMNLQQTAITFQINTMTWVVGQVPVVTHADDSTNSITARKFTIRAQKATGTTSTGGSLDMGPGQGTSAGGLGRLLSGSAAARLGWNDTGVALYAATPVAQPSRIGQLTDSTTGTPSSTIGDAGAVFSQVTLNNIHASLLAKINALELLLHNVGASA